MFLSCAHSAAAAKALKSLGVNALLLDCNHDRCYCSECEPEDRKRRDGEGGIPRGFTRFATAVQRGQAEARGVFSTWKKGFHGTKHSRVSSVVELGSLLCPGATPPEGNTIEIRDGHLKQGVDRDVDLEARLGRIGNVSKILVSHNKVKEDFKPHRCAFLSSNHAYAAHRCYAETKAIHGLDTTFLLEFRIRPSTFDEGSHTFNSDMLAEVSSVSGKFAPSPDSWEWFTDRHGVMMLTGVLVRVHLRRSIFSRGLFHVPGEIPPLAVLKQEQLLLSLDSSSEFLKFLRCPVARRRFEILLKFGLPQCLFNAKIHKCFCAKCEPDNGMVYSRADHEYRLPHGYTGFGICIDHARTTAWEMWDKWPVAYHGTSHQRAPHYQHWYSFAHRRHWPRWRGCRGSRYSRGPSTPRRGDAHRFAHLWGPIV